MGSLGLSQSPKAEDGGIWVPTTPSSWDPTSVQSKGGCITSVGGRGGWTGGQCLGGWGKSGGRKDIASPCPLTWGARWLRGSASQRPQGEGGACSHSPKAESRGLPARTSRQGDHFQLPRVQPAPPAGASPAGRLPEFIRVAPPTPHPAPRLRCWKDCDSLTATSMSPTRERQDRSSEHFKTRYKIRAGFACFS